jgi:hypothetical protein
MYVRGLTVALALAALCASSACNDGGNRNHITGPAPLPVAPGEGGSQPPADDGTVPGPAPLPSPVPPERGPNHPGPLPEPPESASCRHSAAQWAIGERASQELLEQARVAAGAKIARFLRPDDVTTLEYAAWRLNLRLDDKDMVRSVVCG